MSMYVLAINEFALTIFKNKIIVPCLLVKYGPKKKKPMIQHHILIIT